MNNLLHLKYALEVARAGSFSKAAKNLYMGQPQLSKAVRELENSLGAPIFNRTSKGVFPTERGEKYLEYAKDILARVDKMQSIYKPCPCDNKQFSVCVPRASYISDAFCSFVNSLPLDADIDFNYSETDSARAVSNITEGKNNISIIRYQCDNEEQVSKALDAANLDSEVIWEFQYSVLMSYRHPLAKRDAVVLDDLKDFTEITDGKISAPWFPGSKAKDPEKNIEQRRIIAYEGISRFELLSRLSGAFMLVPPVSAEILNRFSLVLRPLCGEGKKYKDVLIYKQGYLLSPLDKLFCENIKKTVRLLSNNV